MGEPFDFFAPEVTRDPYPALAALREHSPLYWSERLRAYVLTRHEDVVYALRNPALFSSTQLSLAGQRIESFSPREAPGTANLVHSDPPVHTRMRARVGRAFTAPSIARLEPRLRELVRELVTRMTAGPEFDLVEDFTAPLPVRVISEMMGVEPERHRDFRRWSSTIIYSATNLTTPHPDAARDQEEMHAYMTRVARQRRAEPREDLISQLVQDQEGQLALSPEEINAFALVLLLAGTETITHLLGNAVLTLLRHPEQLAWLVRHPEACADALEEVLRYDAPVLALLRRSTQEVELSGGRLPAESMVVLMSAAANRDPRQHAEPDRFDIQRSPQGHLSFGHGGHHCLGSVLARLEAPLALRELLSRVPRMAFASRQGEVDYPPSFAVRGPRSLWLRAA